MIFVLFNLIVRLVVMGFGIYAIRDLSHSGNDLLDVFYIALGIILMELNITLTRKNEQV